MVKLYPEFPETEHEIDIKKNYVEIRKSNIPGAGVGVFAKKDIKADTDLGWYRGEHLSAEEFGKKYDKKGYSVYVLCVDNDINVDATKHYNWISRINASKGTNKKPNVYWDSEGRLFAKKNIKAGEELYVCYGAEYWRGITRYNKTLKKRRSS